MLILPFLFVLSIAVFLAWLVRQFLLKLGSGTLSASLAFAIIVVLPWIDAIPGYAVFTAWKRSHPTFRIVEQVETSSVFVDGDAAAMLSIRHDREFFLEGRRSRATYFGINIPSHLTGDFFRLRSYGADALECSVGQDGRGANSFVVATQTGCRVVSVEKTTTSNYALVDSYVCDAGVRLGTYTPFNARPLKRMNDSVAFPVFGTCTKIINLKTGRVIAESWSGYYAPYIARHLTLIPKFASAPTAAPIHEFWSRVLLPQKNQRSRA
jgi:hypothetical protein